MNRIDEVRRAIGRRAAAMVAADVDAVAALLDPRCVYTHSSGLADTKDSYVAALRKREYAYHAVDLAGIDHAIEVGALVILNCAMRVSMTVRSTGERLDRAIRVTEAWTDEGDAGWQLLVSHSTHRS